MLLPNMISIFLVNSNQGSMLFINNCHPVYLRVLLVDMIEAAIGFSGVC